jgi:Domain of unknown function (DUF4253)
MSLSQSERDLAAEIDFDESVLEAIKQEYPSDMQKLLLEQEVYLKDSELSCLNEVLPQNYLDFIQDIYGAYNYGGNLFVEGLSVSIPPGADCRHIFFKLKYLLASQGYLTVCNKLNFNPKQHRLKQFGSGILNYLLQTKLKITVFKAEDPLDIIKIYQTNGWNYGVSPRDIIKKLKLWQEICEFEIIFTSNSRCGLEFTKLPEDMANFADDVHKFCSGVQNSQSAIREIEKSKSLYLSWD